MAVRLPKANTCEDFWQLMVNGTDTVGKLSPERAADIEHAVTQFRGQLLNEDEPFFTGSFFRTIDEFDADIFRINPREALFIEPEQRLFLEATWELLEDAGYASSIRGSNTGVYVGNTINKYKYILTENHPSISHGNHSPFISSRVSYTHDLQGPAMMVATGCSSSLLAVHLACQGLYTGDCEMAIAGGVTLDLLPISTKTDIWNQLGITGPNIRCRAFDALAKGIAKGEGCGVVLLKPLHKAVSDSDHIYGVLEATTANQNGHSNSITAPHPGAQAKLLCQAWKRAKITPDKLGYFEAHGTGTEIGDPIEISGITTAFKNFGLTFDGESSNRIPIGSVKANIGHLADGGAGVTALIKVLLCMRKCKIPQAANFSDPNPHINWKTAPVFVNTVPLDWKQHSDEAPRYASVSAFGLLGTNTHVVVREYTPAVKHSPQILQDNVLEAVSTTAVMSLAANSQKSLLTFAAKMAKYFGNSEDQSCTLLRSVCYTLNTGRDHARFQHRAVAYASTWDGMKLSLEQLHRALKEANSYIDSAIDSTTGFATCFGDNCHSALPDPHGITADFLNGKKVSWKQLYSGIDPNMLTKVPMLPTYAFDRIRYWPKAKQPLNVESEHTLDYPAPGNDSSSKTGVSAKAESDDSGQVIQAALNEALGTRHEWNELANVDLFQLGLDSLMCAQVCMNLQHQINCTFSMSEFHQNPTYNGLKVLVQEKLKYKQQNVKPSYPMLENGQPASEYLTEPCSILVQQGLSHREHILLSSWMEVLESTEEPQDTDNFLKCGGDSLSAVFLVSKIRRTCEIEISIQDLLQNPEYEHFKNIVLHANHITDSPQEQQMNDDRYLPLSAAQQRMVIMQLAAPHSTAYVETIVRYTRNSVITPATPFEDLVKCHPILKCRIELNHVSQMYEMSTVQNDLIPDVEPEILQDVQLAVDYIRNTIPVIEILSSPLVRFRTLISGDFTIFVVHMHHIIIDEVTLVNISSSLQKLVSNATLSTETAKLAYGSFVDFERKYCSSTYYTADRKLWQETFATIPSSASLSVLPKSEPGWKDTEVYKARHKSLKIPANTVQKISKYCDNLGITNFQYYLACTSLIVQTYLGTDEVTLAIPVTTRTDAHRLTDGLFVNTVMFRLHIDTTLTWSEYIRMVSTKWLNTLHHSQYPFDQVTKQIWKQHGRSSSTFCSVMYKYATYSKSENELRILSKDAKMPLSLDVISDSNSNMVEVLAEWAVGLIDNGVAERLADSFVRICLNVFDEPEKQLQDIDILSPQEHKLLDSFITFPESESDFEEHNNMVPIHRVFEMHTAASPEAVAVCCDSESLSYRQLNEKASRIAQGLCKNVEKSTLKEGPVVIVMKKAAEVIATILGIWKAGGHFLPVASSANTKSCLRDILERCRPAAILYNDPLDCIQDFSMKCITLSVDELIQFSLEVNSGMADVEVCEDDLAYIIRTSGSTGRPKHCQVTHKSLGIIANAWKRMYKMSDFKISVLQWAPLSFDVFIGDVVRGLICAPGQLTICPDKFRLDVSHILALIRKHGVSIAEVTPMFGLQLVENARTDDLKTLQILILGSDVLSQELYKKVRSQLGTDQRVINSYGMTEATIDSSFFEGNDIPKTRTGTVPIGRPLPGVCMRILNPRTLQPSPVGTVGELYISGQVLASGDAECTWLKQWHCWALKTGDAACWLPSGNIELAGRLDSMVKIRGFRISTTEIENKIIRLISDVHDACVVPMTNNENPDGGDFLCAFVVLNKGVDASTVTQKYLCDYLISELPYYMLPDMVEIINEVPLTAHGKLNYKALPTVSQLFDRVPVNVEGERISSDSQTIMTLAVLFAEAMGMPDSKQIQHERTFMEQGGHSLILIRFSSLIRQKTNFDIGIADIFSYPTITALANYIDRRLPGETKPGEHHADREKNGPKGDEREEDIAITGIGLRLPGGIVSLPQLWNVLEKGDDLIGDFPKDRVADVLSCLSPSASQVYSRANTYQGAFLECINLFDDQFFEIPPDEAKFMSPEQRLFLQVATEALAESQGLSKVKGAKIGVFVGYSEVGYSHLNHPDKAICVSGLTPGMIATRVAYQWDLKGPTMLTDTACSSSLVALKQACESIKTNECEGALVGGVSLILYPSRAGVYVQTNILSPSFHCRAFDKDADGTVRGEGVLCIYVEKVSKALSEEKPIYAVIKGIASNSVGHGNSITSPSSSSEAKVIQEALNTAQVRPSDVTFIEGHGTGTQLGDRIELAALGAVFNEAHKTEPLPIGSAKSVLGHLDSAAGLLGVFKVLASLMTKQISPTAHFKSPHPELSSSLTIPAESIPWKAPVRVAGVSAFGLTGTNCHVVLAECGVSVDAEEFQMTEKAPSPLLLCGNSLEQLKKQSFLHKVYVQHFLPKGNEGTLSSLCYTVAQRLHDLNYIKASFGKLRMVIMAERVKEVLAVLDIISSAKNIQTLIRLANLRSDVYLCCPQSKEMKQTSTAIERYLLKGTIAVGDLFPSHHHTRGATAVTIAMYEERRHWLDKTTVSTGVTGTSSGGLLELVRQKLEDTREIVRMLPLAPPQGLRETQRDFCAAIIIQLLLCTEVGEHLHSNGELALKEAFALSGMLVKYEKLFFVMIRELMDNNLVVATGNDKSMQCLDSFKFNCQHFLEVDPEILATSAIERYPSWADCFRFPLYCSKSLHSVLQGSISPLSVIYPQGDLNFMYQFDKLGDLLGDVYYNMYMQMIAAYAIQLSGQRRRVRILEVGAGVGHVTRQLLPKLKDSTNIEYWFTDLGKTFVDRAKSLFSEYQDMMQFSTFDITKSAPKQGLLGSFDIVISCNVIHTTESIMESVANLRTCIGDDGTLFIIESAKNETWATLAWGILDGWWLFKDYHLRPAEPMLEPEKWQCVLTEAGFASICTIPVDEHERSHVEKFLFICTNVEIGGAVRVNAPTRGWWEVDTHNFVPIKHHNELEASPNREPELDRQGVLTELRTIWSELLGVENIQEGDDFNSLGGESLLVTQMMNEVHRRIGYQLEIADTFGYPTLAALATFISDGIERLISNTSQAVTVTTSGKGGRISANGLPPPSGIELEETVPVLPADKDNQSTLLMFPGQGAQKVGMCVSMKDSPEANAIFKRAEQILGYNILDICLRTDSELEERLKSAEFVQVSLFVGCLAKVEQLKAERPNLLSSVTHVAGLSVGEFAALVYADVIDFESALRLVQVHGEAMDAEASRSSTAMVSVFGPQCEQLQTFLNEKFPSIQIATYLADNQHTVAGKKEDCDVLVEELQQTHRESLAIIDVRKLRVAGAFHSPYMKQAADKVNPIVEGLVFSRPTTPLIMNVNGQIIEDPAEINALLCQQLVAPVKWKQTVLKAYECGVRNAVEVSPSCVLSSIVKNRISTCKDCTTEFIAV